MSFFKKEVLHPSLRKLNLKPQPEDTRDLQFLLRANTRVSLPSKRSLRRLLFNPPIYNQWSLGSCTANAVNFAFQYEAGKEKMFFNSVPSRLFTYYNARLIDGTQDLDVGCYIRSGIKAISTLWVLPESDYPYDISIFAVKPPQSVYDKADDSIPTGYYSVKRDLYEIKLAIYRKYPVVCWHSLFAEINDVTKLSPILKMPKDPTKSIGGHAMAIVGYDDSIQCFTFRNSWGDGWGDGGYFYVPYEYVMKYGFDFWVISKM